MSAFIRVVEEKDWPILGKYLDEDGVILVSKQIADQLEEKIGRPIDGEYLDGYNFGGDADQFVEMVCNEHHYSFQEILDNLKEDECDD